MKQPSVFSTSFLLFERNEGSSKRVLNTTTVNQALGLPGMFSTFTDSEFLNLRVIAIVASFLSMFVGVISIFLLHNVDRRKRLFRHDLIMFLIICDFLKAMILAIYPIVILANISAYANPVFYNTLGWFTAYAIEGADIAIMFFDLHFALLIFKPNWKWRNNKTQNMEGGLFKYRNVIWPVTILFPSIMASLTFINFNVINREKFHTNVNVVLDNNHFNFKDEPREGGFKPLSAWSYLPATPMYYKYFLSWGPRYVLIASIFTIYISIYIYVHRESKKIKEQLTEFNIPEKEASLPPLHYMPDQPFAYNFKIFFQRFVAAPMRKVSRSIRNFFLLSLEVDSDDSLLTSTKSYPISNLSSPDSMTFRTNDTFEKSDPNNFHTNHRRLSYHDNNLAKSIDDDILASPNDKRVFVPQHKTNGMASSIENSEAESDKLVEVRKEFQRQIYFKMKERRRQIQKNLRAIFIYPCSYIAIWLFPILADISQSHHEIIHGPIVWLSYLDTFIRPLSCMIHCIVFILRERPWNLAWSAVERDRLIEKYILKGKIDEDEMIELLNGEHGKKGWFYRTKWDAAISWKYERNFFKRSLWYLGRFLRNIFSFKWDYTSPFDNEEFWNNKYFTKDNRITSLSTLSPFVNTDKGITTLHSLRSLDSTCSSNQKAILNANNWGPKVPLRWRLIHMMPMLHGIDLDGVNKILKERYDDDVFVIPGLDVALNRDARSQATGKQQEHNFKNNLKIEVQNMKDYSTFHKGSQEDIEMTDLGNSQGTPDNFNNFRNTGNREDIETGEKEEEEEEGEIDLLAFLNGP
ncbi:hypothetical protein KAFR_0F02170 [Kazachstania africana CBS 2517]|uniref:G-protein coupled receptors family 1 profile domain-containing protein n=1 Tax=Kazachstania africana (strain ATCC 22294 / BCRC 22015 / CBS 2517 / CECT 1963 / NBRC 1671 / NRRL Y-8276) TaxID=1071382 RepID=H2AWR4_KAZAF|nr:hypothetical protein KAFR_0F02170 [Kazachstania africana CBS 2517]CCF58814.1 hypothetical protein KAFR_0F02170 [Kazachstania africana CBS 2517]